MKSNKLSILIAAVIAFAFALAACGSANSPTGVYKTYQQALRDKNAAKVKSVMSKKMLTVLEEGAKRRKTTSDEMIASALPMSPVLPTVVGEKIDGDKATLEVKDSDGKPRTESFVKEDGNWKYDG